MARYSVAVTYIDMFEVEGHTEEEAYEVAEAMAIYRRQEDAKALVNNDASATDLWLSNWHIKEIEEKTSTRCAYCDQTEGHKMSCESPANKEKMKGEQ